MNKWVKKSINLVKSKSYLDNLFEVYPVELGIARDLSEEIKTKVKKAFKCKNETNLIKALLTFPKFPIDDPYIPSLRKYPYLLEKNPKTIKRIGKRLLSMGANIVLELAAKPKSPSRQLGHSFKNWLCKIKYPFLTEEEFKNYNAIAFLEGSDEELKQFAIKELKIKRLSRRPDFILRIKNKFILGEAKFLSDHGGTQNNQFDGALKITKIKTGKVSGIAVLDGIVWFESKAYMHRRVKKIKGIALSALLLKEFIRSFR